MSKYTRETNRNPDLIFQLFSVAIVYLSTTPFIYKAQ